MRSVRVTAALILAALACATPAAAQEQRCRVTDPTGTPLNLREAPQGRIIGTLPNGRLVGRLEERADARGKTWVRVRDFQSGQSLGWVFREFVSCF